MSPRLRSSACARIVSVLTIVLAALAIGSIPAASQMPRLYTNEQMVDDVTRTPMLAIEDPMAVLAFVLSSLPERVTVYPTENYYYFWFYHNATRYAGNIRLDVIDRDAGKLHFAYFKDFNEWTSEPDMKYVRLDATNGVQVERLDYLKYRVTFRGRSVEFSLNNLSKVAAPASLLGPNERYLGPVFDESAIRFFLLYNSKLRVFHYILDETVPVTDELVRSEATDRILIGRRTGFAFYKDHRLDRKILIGVFDGNSRSNNYYDGPFDQLPDNFIHDESLRDAILAVEPHLKGKIDRYGISPDAANRYMIGPYLHYRTEQELDVFHECATSKAIPASEYYNCFVIEENSEEQAAEPPAPSAPQPKQKSGKSLKK
jgi:hypothetical protein